jgi:hypothetical protein
MLIKQAKKLEEIHLSNNIVECRKQDLSADVKHRTGTYFGIYLKSDQSTDLSGPAVLLVFVTATGFGSFLSYVTILSISIGWLMNVEQLMVLVLIANDALREKTRPNASFSTTNPTRPGNEPGLSQRKAGA